ncbi:hypothetical protein K435DRAFT_789815 [Dendrothele bispora CBS 962.96]|uniref:Uncharacterized protein n=1 Tax=Dendrothele bispora (strain CBS 962.96) TaxID=1314807 RepID=A0A4S8MSH2_DENBC|nr:hypothetical protein K435DRAFT_789815 [Dendrothele bispora CBS 962.96]
MEAEKEAERKERKAEMEAERKERKAEMEAERKERKAEMEAERKERKAEMEAERKKRKAEMEAERKERKAEMEAERKERKAERRLKGSKAEYNFLASESIVRIIQSRNDFVMSKLEPVHAEALHQTSEWNWIMKWMDSGKDHKLTPELQAACNAARSKLEPGEIPLLQDLHQCLKSYRYSRNVTAHPIATLSTARELVRKAIIDTFSKRQPKDVEKVIDYAIGHINQEPGRKATDEELKQGVILKNGLVPLFKKDDEGVKNRLVYVAYLIIPNIRDR